MKYNVKEKIKKPGNYRMNISGDLIDAIYEKTLHKMIVEKKYHDPKYNATILSKEIGTNPRYLSAAVSLRFQSTFSELINGYRIREAIGILSDKRAVKMTMEEVSRKCGFLNRQTFYAAFFRATGVSPKKYQKTFFEKLKK